jgi:hypothetical protein
MNALMYLNKKQIQKHALTWMLIIIFLNLVDPVPGSWAAKIIGSFLINLNYIFVFYILSLFIFPKFWLSKRIYLVLGIISCLIIFWASNYIVFLKIIPALGGSTYFQSNTFYFFLVNELELFFIIGAAGTSSFFNRYGLYKLKQQTDKEKVLLVKELNYLKNQFNSHITFNFLNYCYSNIHKHSPETAESIGLFSEILRYTLQTEPEEKVALSKEIIYIENFISLQKLLSAKVYANFSYDGDIGDKKVLSRILVTFVENAFKHGVLNDPKSPILINLMVNDNELAFTVNNKINRSKRIESTNKGMENVTQILDLYYANNYKLKRGEDGEVYSVELRMGLGEELVAVGSLQ